MSSSRMTKSSMSQLSARTANETEDLSDVELVKLVNDIKFQLKVFRLENEILEKTIMRLDPNLMHGVQQALDYAAKNQTLANISSLSWYTTKSQASRLNFDVVSSPSRMIASPSRVSSKRGSIVTKFGGVTPTLGVKINVLERAEFVSYEIQVLINDTEKKHHIADKKRALYRAKMEEISARVTEVEKAQGIFETMVLTDGVEPISQRIPAEIWVRYMAEWLKSADSQIEKLRLKTSTLHIQYANLKAKIKIKAEYKEHLRPVDFEKTLIDNHICRREMKKISAQTHEIKAISGDMNLTVTLHKKAAAFQTRYLNKVIKDIEKRKNRVVEFQKVTKIIAAEAKDLRENLQQVKETRQKYVLPDISDYILVSAELSDLKKEVKMLENKRKLQDYNIKAMSLKLRKRS